MMRRYISRLHPRFVRSLVYMLQASEYKIGDYLAWHHRVRDFKTVETRKHLTKSVKAICLIIIAWVCWFLIVYFGLWLIFKTDPDYRYLFGLMVLLSSPILLVYAVILPLVFVQWFIQKPIEFVIIYRARKKLAKHQGVKIGIAGSFGKTSMREILKTVLSEDKKVAAPPHSYNTPLGISKFIQTLRGDEEVLIFEFGEYYPGDVRKLCRLVRPDIGIITGINEAHLEKFRTLDKTVETIYEIADFLGSKLLYVNGESGLARENARDDHVIYERHGLGDWTVINSTSDLFGTSFSLVKNGVHMEVNSSLLGLHQIGPLAVSVDLARRLGVSPQQIRSGIAKTKPFDHRLYPTTDKNDITTLDDSYNGNPDGVTAVIAFLASLGGRRFYVTPGLVEMGARNEDVHRQIGRELAKAGIEKVVLIKNSVTPFIRQGLKEECYKGEVIWFDDALSAFAALSYMTVKGDVILLQNDWPDQYA